VRLHVAGPVRKEYELSPRIGLWVPQLTLGLDRVARGDGYRRVHVGWGAIYTLVVDCIQRRCHRRARLRDLVNYGKRFRIGHAVPVVHGDVDRGHPVVLGVDAMESQARSVVNQRKGSRVGGSAALVESDHRAGFVPRRRSYRTTSTGLAELPLAKPERELALSGLRRVRTVDQVLLNLGAPIATEVSSNRSWGGGCWVRCAGE